MTRICPNCKSKIEKRFKHCPQCNFVIYGVKMDLKRAILIKNLLESDLPPTLQEIGSMFGITRERIRQIYSKYTGKPVMTNQNRRSSLRHKIKDYKVIGFCQNCCVDIQKKDVPKGSKRKYLYCKECYPYFLNLNRRHSGNERSKIPIECSRCHLYFHPFFTNLYANKTNRHFCSRECYLSTRFPDTYKNL